MISVIGAGPVGSYAAMKLVQRGHNVHLFEADNKIGHPIQCTGIITKHLRDYIKIDKKFLVGSIKRARITAPNGESMEVTFREEDYLVCRTKFDQHMAELAEKEGVKLHLSHRYKGQEGSKIKVGDKVLSTDALIGCDGPMSRVAKANAMYGNRKLVAGNQVTVETDTEDGLMEIWLGHGMFSWCVPEGDGIARVGLVSYDKPAEHLQRLLDMRCPGGKIVGRQPGMIPLYNHRQPLQKGNVFLLGDAATQVKATTFGGIIHGMKAGDVLADDMKSYEKNCRRKVGRDLYVSLLLRKAMDRFSEKDYNDLVTYANKDKLNYILQTKSRDFPTKFMFSVFLAEPRLLKFAKRLVF